MDRLERHCLVTVGATATFTQLLKEVMKPPFLNAIVAKEFTHITVQCGADMAWARDELVAVVSSPSLSHLQIKTFDFVEDLVPEMVNCRAEDGKRSNGVIVCHGGTGTILDCLRVNAPLVVVPNPTLKDNHQAELAEEMENQGYAIWGRLGCLEAAIDLSERLCESKAKKNQANEASPPPKESELPASGGLGLSLWGICDAMMERHGIKSAASRGLEDKDTGGDGASGQRKVEAAPETSATTSEAQVKREEAARMEMD